MTMLEWLAASPAALVAVCAALGLVVGSFLNVVILRLPRMLEQSWRAEAREMLEMSVENAPRVTLASPPSTCPHCGARIRAWHNIPVLSWLWLRGRASCCGGRISAQYPVVELAAGLLAAGCAWRFGYGPELLATLFLAWVLLVAAVIDWNTQLLPDNLTLPLMWVGLLFSVFGGFVPLEQSVIGAAAGYLSLWSIYHLFRLLTGKEGMGYGDFKLLAALGAWFGWMALPMIVLLCSAVGAVVGITLMLSGRIKRGQPMPFGPFIAGAGLVWLFWQAGGGMLAP
jgi:leader peptidase (prepilin peptidase)/N-methyltransferase